jgi:hypothetical protein
VLKHLKGWSFRELERELRCNLTYRRFTLGDLGTEHGKQATEAVVTGNDLGVKVVSRTVTTTSL